MKKSLKISLLLFFITALVTITGVIYFKIFKPVGQSETETSQPGRWVQPRQTATKIDKVEYEKLIGLGYLQGYEATEKNDGVTIYKKEKAYSGINLVLSGHAPEAFLMSMDGKILHRWQYKIASKIWSGNLEGKKVAGAYWRRAYVYPNGDLLAIYDNIGMIKLDKNSNLLWEFASPTPHHDLDLGENGNIHVLTSKRTELPELAEGSVQEEFITILSSDGKALHSYSLIDLIQNSPFANLLNRKVIKTGGFYGHILHSNSLEIFDGSLEHKSPLFKKGNILVSILMLDTIAIFDLAKQQLVWALGSGLWKSQHQPTLLKNGNMLIFDNKDSANRSQVLEFDPFTQKVIWEYSREKEYEFFSQTCGSNQRLPNGNTLITETDRGRAFEVTRDKEIVWEYINPYRTGEQNELFAVVPEVVRLNPEAYPFVKDKQ
jgi:hypothetical protein